MKLKNSIVLIGAIVVVLGTWYGVTARHQNTTLKECRGQLDDAVKTLERQYYTETKDHLKRMEIDLAKLDKFYTFPSINKRRKALWQEHKYIQERMLRSAETELMKVASEGDIDRTKAILDIGLDPNVRDENGLTALHLSAQLKIVYTISFDLQGKDLEARQRIELEGFRVLGHDFFGKPFVGIPDRKGHDSVTRVLIEKGADVNAKDKKGITPIMKADLEAITILFKSGADVNAKDNDGNTALHHVAQNLRDAPLAGKVYYPALIDRYQKDAEYLLDYGADVNARNVNGETPLDIAAEQWRSYGRAIIERAAPFIDFFLKRGAKYNKLLYK